MAGIGKRRSPPNILALINFDDLVNDAALDEVFFASSERDATTALSWPQNHPLHPDFTPANRSTGGLLARRSKPPVFDLESLARTQKERVTAHWSTVRNHHLYRYWMDDRNFQSAYGTFENLRKRSHSAAGYRHAYAEFRFVRVTIRHVTRFSTNAVRRSANAKVRRSTIGHIDALLNDMTERGAKFDDFSRDLQLMKILGALKTELSARTRKPRHDEARPFRDFDMSLTRALLETFGVASPVIVKQLARAIGSTLDERTIESHIKAARNEGNLPN
jgi:hypothetical protein